MLSKLIFFIKRKYKYKTFHKKYKFCQSQILEILHKVKYNFAEILTEDINFNLIKNLGLKLDIPLYIEFAKNVNFDYAKNLWLAQKIFNFNLIIFYTNEDILAKQKFLKFAKFLDINEVSYELKKTLFSLNINTKNFCLPIQKITPNIQVQNYKKVETTYQDFIYKTLYAKGDSLIKIEQTFYNGNYYYFLKNNKKINILIKKIINFNYFLIKKLKNQIILTNLITKEHIYIISNIPKINVKISKTKDVNFSVVLINLTISASSNKPFLYIGKEKVDIEFAKEKENIFEAVKNQFNYKIYSKNNKINYFFNYFLPKKFIFNLIFNQQTKIEYVNKNFGLEEIYTLYKNKKIDEVRAYTFFKKSLFFESENFITFNSKISKNFLLKFWFLGQQKNIKFTPSQYKKICFGRVEYKNCLSLPYKVLENENQFEVFL